MGPPNIKKMLQIKIKPRQDSFSDQFSRIFMVKLLMLTAAVTGISWMKDKVTCIVPYKDASPGFVSKSCWINGFYIYKDIPAADQSIYYGIPKNVLNDGIDNYDAACETKPLQRKANTNCKPMKKTFFLQYQWFPLFIAAIAYIYYLPYLLFKIVNKDMQDVKEKIKGKKLEEINLDLIIEKFFTREKNTNAKSLVRVLLNIVVKVLYVFANVLGLIFVDSSLNSGFVGFGAKWSQWTGLSSEQMHDYTDTSINKPGNKLLPAFGLCKVLTSGKDVKIKVFNTNTYICELSQHVLYQYILIVMWYMFIFGIVVSVIGLAKHMFTKIVTFYFNNGENKGMEKIMKRLNAREKEYLDFIRRKNMPVYGSLLVKLRETTEEALTTSSGSTHSSFSPEKESLMMS